jgi:DNA polymerase V
MEDEIVEFIESKGHSLPFYSSPVQAGLPTAIGSDETPERLNVYTMLVDNPDETYFVKASGESMINAGINSGDLMVVNKKIPAKEGAVVVASVNGEFTVKRLSYKGGKPFLMPENKKFKSIPVNEHDDVVLFGVVTHSIHQVV